MTETEIGNCTSFIEYNLNLGCLSISRYKYRRASSPDPSTSLRMYSGETSPPCVLAGIIERGFNDSGGVVIQMRNLFGDQMAQKVREIYKSNLHSVYFFRKSTIHVVGNNENRCLRILFPKCNQVFLVKVF